MTRSFQISPAYVKGLAFVLTVVIFCTDWWTPNSINISIFYACVIVALAWTQSMRWVWGWTLLTAALTITGLASGNVSFNGHTWVESTNRCITVFMLAVTAGFAHFSILIVQQLDSSKRLLAEITARKRAEDSLRKAQDELAHVTRVTTMGELAASIAHEVNQPLSGIVINGNACLRWLGNLGIDSPNLDEARQATERIIRDGKRAGEVITRLRAFFKKAGTEKVPLQINEVIGEVVALVQSEMENKRVALRMELTDDLPSISGDRVQLQQVILNLILNGAEAMSTVENRKRDLVIRTKHGGEDEVLVEVQDMGPGIDSQKLEKIFDAFYTTKPGGMGMGLSISRSIIENHGGRLRAVPNTEHGATFLFTVMKQS